MRFTGTDGADLGSVAGERRITCIDAHTAGEPLRVVTSGFPALPGDTMLAKRRRARDHHDELRRFLMLEPRGHADMYGCLLTPPVTPDGDVGVLFMHNAGFSTMCGHGIIGLVKVGVETGMLVPEDAGDRTVRIDTPAGRVVATAHMEGARVTHVSFLNVPSFVLEDDMELEVPRVGRVRFDIAFGGAFYAYVDASQIGLALVPARYGAIIDAGRRIKRTISSAVNIMHPDGDDDLDFLYGTVFTGPAQSGGHSRNVCVFADGEVDRSPTGTGVSGRAAIHFGSGDIGIGEEIRIESLIGTHFDVAVEQTGKVGGLDAVVPRVTGAAYITGRSEFVLEPGDPLADGVLLR